MLDGAETAVLGAAATVTGIVGLAAGQPVLGVVAGGLGLTAGLLGWRHAVTGASPAVDPTSAIEALRATELSEELSLARLREQALNQRIEMLENAARAAASSASGLRDLHDDPAEGDKHLLTDAGTGLFSEAYFDVALEARIAAARRRLRPVALVLLQIVQGPATGDHCAADWMI